MRDLLRVYWGKVGFLLGFGWCRAVRVRMRLGGIRIGGLWWVGEYRDRGLLVLLWVVLVWGFVDFC